MNALDNLRGRIVFADSFANQFAGAFASLIDLRHEADVGATDVGN